MGLFTERPSTSSNAPLYTLGLNRTVLIAGLGNPGIDYEGTRHNIGYEAVDALAISLDMPALITKKDLKCQLSSTMVRETRLILVKPTTFMNLSGEAVQAVLHFYKIPSNQLVVVHDELDIPFGQIRTRFGGGSAGNNGIKSISEHIGEDYGRVRIGTANDLSPKIDSADFVLDKFTKDEQVEIPKLLKETTAILTEYLHGSQLTAETRSFL